MATTTTTRKATQHKAPTVLAEVQKEGPPGKKPSGGHIVIQYTQGLGDSFKMICSKYGIHTHFKGNMTLKQLLVIPKDQDPKDRKSGVIYSYQCGEIGCGEEYIGEHLGPWGKDIGST